VDLDGVIRSLVDAGSQCAFHGNPGDGIAPLTAAIKLGRAGRDVAMLARASWLLQVCVASTGLFGSALHIGRELRQWAAADTALQVQDFAALSATTSASVLRQIGQYSRAQELDESALAIAGARVSFDARIGLAADAVGDDDIDQAESMWQGALAASDDHDWRQQVRLGWVEAEIAFMSGDAAKAAEVGARSSALARQARAPRHCAKSGLFWGVGLVGIGQAAEGSQQLRSSLGIAMELELGPLIWPIAGVLADVLGDDDPVAARGLRGQAWEAITTTAADLPPNLARVWLARPEIGRIETLK